MPNKKINRPFLKTSLTHTQHIGFFVSNCQFLIICSQNQSKFLYNRVLVLLCHSVVIIIILFLVLINKQEAIKTQKFSVFFQASFLFLFFFLAVE